MPRYAVTTNFNEEEMQRIRDKCKQDGMTAYKLLREAVLKYVREKKESVNGKGKLESGRAEEDNKRGSSDSVTEQLAEYFIGKAEAA